MPEAATLDIKKSKVANQWKYDRPLLATRISPTGLIAVTSSEDFQMQRWDLSNGERVVFKGHESWVHALQFSADGSELVSGGCEGTLMWWPILDAEPKPKRTVQAHQGWIRAIDRSPDGQWLASVGNDATVRVWSWATGDKVAELAGHERHIYSVLFHPDGKHLFTGDLMGKLHLWDVTHRNLNAVSMQHHCTPTKVDNESISVELEGWLCIPMALSFVREDYIKPPILWERYTSHSSCDLISPKASCSSRIHVMEYQAA